LLLFIIIIFIINIMILWLNVTDSVIDYVIDSVTDSVTDSVSNLWPNILVIDLVTDSDWKKLALNLSLSVAEIFYHWFHSLFSSFLVVRKQHP